MLLNLVGFTMTPPTGLECSNEEEEEEKDGSSDDELYNAHSTSTTTTAAQHDEHDTANNNDNNDGIPMDVTLPFELRPPLPNHNVNNQTKNNTPINPNHTHPHVIAPGSLRRDGAYALIDLVRVRVVAASPTTTAVDREDGMRVVKDPVSDGDGDGEDYVVPTTTPTTIGRNNNNNTEEEVEDITPSLRHGGTNRSGYNDGIGTINNNINYRRQQQQQQQPEYRWEVHRVQFCSMRRTLHRAVIAR